MYICALFLRKKYVYLLFPLSLFFFMREAGKAVVCIVASIAFASIRDSMEYCYR